MKILVQKFGGTSVVDEKARTAVKDKVQQAIRSGYAPVVVVSAIGRKGAPYATDTLIDFLKNVNLSVNVREQDMLMCCGEIISACTGRQALLPIRSLVRHALKTLKPMI